MLGLVATATLALGGVALADEPEDVLVPTDGMVHAKAQDEWQITFWKVLFARAMTSSQILDGCYTQHTRFGPELLIISGFAAGSEHFSCRARTGEPIYFSVQENECSTVEQPTVDASDLELRICARRYIRQDRTHQHAWIDGHSVGSVRRFTDYTQVFGLRVPRHNLLGTSRRRARSAASGYGLVIRSLSAGRHTLRRTFYDPSSGARATVSAIVGVDDD